jgi:putative photosynthetic complex assembly protein
MDSRTAPVAHTPHIPRVALIAAGALLAFTLLAVGAVRLSGVEVREPDAAAVAIRALRFEDMPDGGVAVYDARDGSLIDTVTGESGFFRGTMRGFARERKRAGGGSGQPFELIARADGRLTLHDPVTRRVVDLEAFGPVNAGVFARLLAPSRPAN